MSPSHKQLPPSVYWVWLSQVPRVGPRVFFTLLQLLHSPEHIYTASHELLLKHAVPRHIADSITLFRHTTPAELLWARLQHTNICVAIYTDEHYPYLLKQIADPPPVLYYYGTLDGCASTCVTVVGSRAHSAYGRQVVEDIVPHLVHAGICVVSGLALGIDTLAHHCAVAQHRPTIAFLGSGVDVISPASNTRLARLIIANGGAIISEFFPGTQAFPSHFPRRNRLLAGISKATLLVEASEKSGSLITARYALEANRDLFVVPGSIFSPLSRGINHLLHQGAYPITSANDLLSHYHLSSSQVAKPRLELTEIQKTILMTLHTSPLHIDAITKNTKLDISIVQSELSILELEGVVKQIDTQVYCKLT